MYYATLDSTSNGIKWDRMAVMAAWASMTSVMVFGPTDTDSSFWPSFVQSILKNPINPPDVNPVYFAVFNGIGISNLILGGLVAPTARKRFRSFLVAFLSSVFVGFSTSAFNVLVRPGPEESLEDEDRHFVATNWILRWTESLQFSVPLILFALLQYVVAFGLMDQGSGELINVIFYARLLDLRDLILSDRIVATSSMDFVYSHLACCAMLWEDMQRRSRTEPSTLDLMIPILAFLCPMLGPAVYLAVREPLVYDAGKESAPQ